MSLLSRVSFRLLPSWSMAAGIAVCGRCPDDDLVLCEPTSLLRLTMLERLRRRSFVSASIGIETMEPDRSEKSRRGKV